VGLAVFLVAVYLLRAILLPFVAGMAIAYFLDPACDRLELWRLSRTAATAVVTLIFAVLVVIALLMIVPLLLDQLTQFITALPDLLNHAQTKLLPYYLKVQQRFDLPDVTQLAALAQNRMGSALAWVAQGLGNLVRGGVAIANLLSLVFVTPVVAFYLLRDWDRIVARVDALLPRHHAVTIRTQARTVDQTLAGFARGQATVCLVLAAYYAVGLIAIGLPFGLVVGIAAGVLTFIPYLGAATGFIIGFAIALVNFPGWTEPLLVAGLFAVGQLIEANFLTPKLVGDRVGLHPVWIIFALLAGGTLFGFLGLLLAVPTAAAIGVLVRFALSRYLDSSVYLGREKPTPQLIGIDPPEVD
jgi:predicted PurR-regulated permease PerM